MIVYKYLSVDVGTKVLTNSSIRFTQPAALNDPFEALWRLDDDSINETINFVRVGLEKEGETITPDLELQIQNGIPNLIDKLHYDFSEVIGFLSLSKKNNKSLMWSHYSDFHKGLVIGFDRDLFKPNHPLVFESKPALLDVEYSESRPIYKQKTGDYEKQLMDLLLTKSIDWQYEEEVRSVMRLSYCDDCLELPNEEYLCHLFNFPQESVREVIFGSRTTLSNREEIQKLALEKYPNAKIFESKQSVSSFDSNILPIPTLK
jgi:Protein of unknown function (DUF2971)